MIDSAEIARRVLEELEDAAMCKDGLTPGVLARRAGLHRGFIARAKRDGGLTIRSLYALCDVLDVDPGDVLPTLEQARKTGHDDPGVM